jgi:hypothetical protein
VAGGKKAGGTMKWFVVFALLLPSCQRSYKHDEVLKIVKSVASSYYGLDVDVKQVGKTLGVRYTVKGLFSELVSEDQKIWKKMDSLIRTLSRVSLSADVPPDFVVLEVVDEENSSNKIVFTQCVLDIRKINAGVISHNQYFDRMAIEFVVNGHRTPFDPEQADLVSLMMMAVEAQAAEPAPSNAFEVSDIVLTDFLSKVAASRTRRLFRENKQAKKTAVLRNATARFDVRQVGGTSFKILLDLASLPGEKIPVADLESVVLPAVAEEINGLFESYKFTGFNKIVVMDKTSGAVSIAGRH